MAKSVIHIGASKGAVVEARKAVLDILKCGQYQSTIRIALEVFRDVTQVKETVITGCNFTITEKGVKHGKK